MTQRTILVSHYQSDVSQLNEVLNKGFKVVNTFSTHSGIIFLLQSN